MNQLLVVCIFCITIIPLPAQVADNFSDGDYHTHPTWQGDTGKFEINAGQELWQNAAAISDTAFLSAFSTVMENTTWEFFCRMEFNPSSANYTRFYLVADQKNFISPLLKGYFVELGRTNDEISLYRQNGTTQTLLIDGHDGLLNTAETHVRIRVTKTGDLWELMADTNGTGSYQSLGTVNDTTYSQTWFTGVWNKYTATRSDKFYLDDIFISGDSVNDMMAPIVEGHTVTGNVLNLFLNEPISITSLNPSNFSMNNGMNVTAVDEDPDDCRSIKITTDQYFLYDTTYTLTISILEDWQGNQQHDFFYSLLIHTPKAGELVINEIMADPTPEVGLPETEYIELFNASAYSLDLGGWRFKAGTVQKILPSYVLNPGDFVLVTDVDDTAGFDVSLPKIGLVSFPALTNGGMLLQLIDTASHIIDEVNYTLAWYHDALQSQGGYSLEKINPLEICMGENNWKASSNFNGGTPGQVNASFNTAFLPIQLMYEWIDSLHLKLVYNQEMDTSSFLMANFILPGLQAVTPIDQQSCILVLNLPLPVNTPFVLSVLTDIKDCMGMPDPAVIEIDVVRYRAALFDLLIHEIMADAEPAVFLPPVEYIELRNTNPFGLPLRGYRLVINGHVYLLGNYTIPADSCMVLMDQNDLSLFNGICTGGITGMNTLVNEGGVIELYTADSILLHAIKYDMQFYDDVAKMNGGWSLEMIDPSKPCMVNKNWTASKNAAGGTPGYRNAAAGTVDDDIRPRTIRTGLEGKDTLLLYFNESVLPLNFQPADLVFSHGLHAGSVEYFSPLLDVWRVVLEDSLTENIFYTFRIEDVSDCEGNIIIADTLSFSIPVFPDHFDVVINEILFDPAQHCIDYMELYNRSDHSVDLSALIVGEGDTVFQTLPAFSPVNITSALLNPGEYICISEDHEKLMSCYFFKDSTAYWDVSFLPDFTNTSGTVGVASFNQQTLDLFSYHADMHFDLLNTTDGVSLERLDPHAATQSNMNWHSAASTVGFGTPGYINSQFSPDLLIIEDFQLEPPIFSPDNDGYQDYLSVHYQLAEPGFIAGIKIFDQTGRLEKTLINNELLGTSGSFIWDGITDDGNKTQVGIHIVFFEVINTKGEHLSFKKPVAVATRF